MWIERDIYGLFKNIFKQFPAIVVTGARQTGKTAGVRHTFPKASYVSLESIEDASLASGDPSAFLSRFKEPLIIDEVQYVPAIFRYLKAKIDENRVPGRFILTGSQPFELMVGVSESLSGRAAIINMPTLKSSEVIDVTGVSFKKCLLNGGFPAIQAQEGVDAQVWFSSYITTYIERDIRNLLSVANLSDFSRFVRALAARSAQLLNIAEVARDVGVAPNTAKKWLSLMEASGQVTRLEPYYRNVGKRVVKTPKIYFNDSGLLCHLLGVRTYEQLISSPLKGAIWETFVFTELIKTFYSEGVKPSMWFWRTSTGEEVDFLVEHGGSFVLIETKFAAHPDKSAQKNFDVFASQYGKKAVLKSFIASTSEKSFPFTDNVVVRPGWGWNFKEL